MSGCGLHFMSNNSIKKTGGVPSLPCGEPSRSNQTGAFPKAEAVTKAEHDGDLLMQGGPRRLL